MNIVDSKSDVFGENNLLIRAGTVEDLEFLVRLESESFPIYLKSAKSSIKNSIVSNSQVVCIAEISQEDKVIPVGSCIAFIYKHSLRIYSIAVDSRFRRQGVGEALINRMLDQALASNFSSITLEVDARNTNLIDWYRKQQFEVIQYLQDYHGKGDSAYRMVRKLEVDNPLLQPFVIVSDTITNSYLNDTTLSNVISPEEYIAGEVFSKSDRFKVVNLCRSYKTHSMGYYVSLMAAARNHKITPSIMAIKDISNLAIAQSLLDEISDQLVKEKSHTSLDSIVDLVVILGKTLSGKYTALGKKLYEVFEVPFFSITIELGSTIKVKKILMLSVKTVIDNYGEVFKKALIELSKKRRYRRTRLKTYKYDLAILVNEKEATPPSCPLALKKFALAAEKVGFFVEFITKYDARRICEFDALFIRETTAVESHTYSIARNAYTEGLVVIDDPWSILLCSNKIYLYERLKNAGVCQPRSWLFSKKAFRNTDVSSLTFPLVLKLPESSFSLGVYCVNNIEELKVKINAMFENSSMVIAQEFLESDYDWRIGIMDGSPIFACKYYMANGHWQIYNWNSEQNEEFSGNSETIAVNQVPGNILKAAVKASSLIGNGLYGVDLKDIDGKAYVIEVNDNPNIDAGIEDSLLGDELYIRILTSIFNRIEIERQQVRYLI